MGMYLSAPATSDDRSERSSRKIGRYIVQDPLPPSCAHRVAFHIASLGLCAFRLQGVEKRSGNARFDLEIPNGDIGGMDVGEGEGLSVIVQGVPFCGFEG